MTKVADFNFEYDYSSVVLWQYDKAENLKAIIKNEQDFVDAAITQFKEEFDTKIFSLQTCDSNGLDLWGRILGVQRPSVNNVLFNDEQYRLVLLSRFSVLVWDGSCKGLINIIRTLFPNALFRVVDNLDMTVNIDFADGLTEEQKVVLRMGYIDPVSGTFVYTFLPRPAGVEYNISFASDWATTLGFEGMTETTNMGGTYDNEEGDTQGTTGIENPDGGVFYK